MSGAGCRVEEKQKKETRNEEEREGTKETDAAGCEFHPPYVLRLAYFVHNVGTKI